MAGDTQQIETNLSHTENTFNSLLFFQSVYKILSSFASGCLKIIGTFNIPNFSSFMSIILEIKFVFCIN